MQMITLTIPYPILLNQLYNPWRGRIVLAPEARAYKDQVGWLCRQEHCTPLDGEVIVAIDAYRPRKSGDIDAVCKLTLDSLQSHCYQNDNQIVELHVYRYDDKTNPRLVVTVKKKQAGITANSDRRVAKR